MARRISEKDLEHYHREGYLILRGAFSRQRIASLLAGVNAVIDLALAGKTEVGRIDQNKRLPNRISHLLAPDKYQPAFGAWLDEDLHPQIETLLAGPPRHSLFGMLAAGGGQPYLQSWHRDSGKPGAPDELAYMNHYRGKLVQFNAPLHPNDHYLHIVPASHTRASTAAEIAASKAGENLSEAQLIDKLTINKGVMPGAIEVQMEPGDIAYYNSYLWHRGWNEAGALRWTIHSAFWRKDLPVMIHEAGQREALSTPGHLDQLPPMTRQYLQRYLDAYPAGEPKRVDEI